MNINRTQLKHLMYGMQTTQKALFDKHLSNNATNDPVVVTPSGSKPIEPTTAPVDLSNNTQNVELSDSMKFFIVS